jgi:peptide subunit release factor 1 (eRF1)
LLRALVRNEQKTAKNIKNNSNRKSVVKALGYIVAKLAEIKKIPDNGMAIYAEIDLGVEILYPPRAITRMIYRCGKEFVVEPVKELFIEPEHLFGVMKVFGSKCTCYLANEFGELTTVSTKTARIQKNHSMGGQSQNRIQRLREETIHNYLKLSSEDAWDAFVKDGQPIIKGLMICGPGLKKEHIKNYLKLDVRIWTHTIDQSTDIRPLVVEMVEESSGATEKKHLRDLMDLLETSADFLTFGKETLGMLDQLDRVYSNVELKNKKTCIINDPFLESLGNLVGVKHFITSK